MSISSREENMLNLQQQICESQRDLQDYLKDLNSWQADITKKDKDLKKKPLQEPKLPPVRNSEGKRRKKKGAKKTKASTLNEDKKEQVRRISGYDYRAWDKFDVDKEIEKVDQVKAQGDEEVLSSSLSESSSEEEDAELQEEHRKQQAIMEKEQGNGHFKEGNYDLAIESYSRAIQLDSTNAILPANRAMALLKQHRYGAAETDCTTALSFDPVYIKAYLRRGAARKALKLWPEAKQDFEQVLKLEPKNSSAQLEIEQVEKEIMKSHSGIMQSDEGIVKAINKPPEERSKSQLRRITIEEIGDDVSHSQFSPSLQTAAASAAGRESQSFLPDNDPFSKLLITRLPVQDETSQGEPNTSHSETGTDIGNDTDVIFDSPAQVITKESHLITELTSTEDNSLASKYIPASRLANDDSNNDSVPLCEPERHIVPGASKESASSSSSTGVPQIPPCPQSSYQFQADCKHLKNNLQAFYQYIKQIDPLRYRYLFGEALDTDILLLIVTVLHDFYIPLKLDVYTPLLCLSSVKRFNMMTMLLSNKEKQGVKAVLMHMKQDPGIKVVDLLTLSDKYHIEL